MRTTAKGALGRSTSPNWPRPGQPTPQRLYHAPVATPSGAYRRYRFRDGAARHPNQPDFHGGLSYLIIQPLVFFSNGCPIDFGSRKKKRAMPRTAGRLMLDIGGRLDINNLASGKKPARRVGPNGTYFLGVGVGNRTNDLAHWPETALRRRPMVFRLPQNRPSVLGPLAYTRRDLLCLSPSMGQARRLRLAVPIPTRSPDEQSNESALQSGRT